MRDDWGVCIVVAGGGGDFLWRKDDGIASGSDNEMENGFGPTNDIDDTPLV